MATQPIGSHSAASSQWYADSSTSNRANLVAGARAALIALVLLMILAVIVLL
jgi:hypothetical protein